MGGDEAVSARVIAGLGMRMGCPADEIVALVRQASAASGQRVAALAAPAFKGGEAGLAQAAATLGLALILVENEALQAAQAGCVTRSALAARAVGVGSVAEGCALAACGAGSRLVLARIAGARATCALAEAP